MIQAITHELTTRERKAIRRLLTLIGDTPVLLIGSVARRRRARADGDIDLLVLSDSTLWDVIRAASPLHVITLSYDDLLRRLMEGDDFAHWALAFGKPLKRRRQWAVLRHELMRHATWPSAESKRERAFSRIAIAAELLAMGDVEAAQEELTFAAGHAARAVLLANGVLPLSRPELPDQLEEIEYRSFADAVRLVGSGDQLQRRPLERVRECLDEVLQQLDVGS